MSIQVTFTVKNETEAAALLKKLGGKGIAEADEDDVEVDEEEEVEPVRTRRAKTVEVEADEDDVEVDEEEYALSDVIKAFQSYVVDNDRKSAAKILAKMGVKNVKELKKAQYAKVMKLLN